MKPGESAYFLAGATAIDTQEDPWMHCQRASSLELTVTAEDTPVVLPLVAGVCAALDVSAWRAGKFDHDPQNAEWGKKHRSLIQGPNCAAAS